MNVRMVLGAVATGVVLAAAGGGMLLLADERGETSLAEVDASPTVDEPGTSESTSPSATETERPSDDETKKKKKKPRDDASGESEDEPEEDPGPSYDVVAVQKKLQAQRYYLGPIDGEPGGSTTSAVMAFQKVNGLSADGVVGPQTLAALKDPVTPPLRSGPATRIEVDLTKQVAYLVEGGELAKVMPVSSGSGASYETESGSTARSLTPVGWFEIERRIEGVREAPLGVLYDPLYFYSGWALHGSNSVPAYPASHGCVRLTRSDATWLAAQIPNGTPVHLYGGTHTFTAGSSAPGTDTPAGDTESDDSSESPSPEPSESKSPKKSESPSPEPSESQSPAKSESPSPEPSESPSSESDDEASPSSSPSPSESPSESETDDG